MSPPPGRLVLPALRWRDDTGFGHERGAIEGALRFGAGGFILFGGSNYPVGSSLQDTWSYSLDDSTWSEVQAASPPPPRYCHALIYLPDQNQVLLVVEPANPIVQTRAFGEGPAEVAAAAAAWIVGCEAAGALACAKHFPGHGRTRTDSHSELPIVGADAALLRATDLEPFRAAVAAGVSSVMTAHVAYPALDPSGCAATFSRPILDILRGELGFEGLIVSDALMMAGARTGRTAAVAGLRALGAGVDLLLYPDDPAGVAAALEQAAQADPRVGQRVEESLARYEAALRVVQTDEPPERLPPAGSATALADWLLTAPLLRGESPRLEAPLELVVVDDDLGGPWPASPNSWLHDTLAARGVPLGPGGSRVILAFAEPRASKGRAGFGAECAAALSRAAPGAAVTILFAHPRLAETIPGDAPILLAWHRQRLMQEAAARWLAARLA